MDGTPEEAGLSASRLARVAELAASFVEHGDHPAVVSLVARHGVVALHEAFGKLGPEPDACRRCPGAALPAGITGEDHHLDRNHDPRGRRSHRADPSCLRLSPRVLRRRTRAGGRPQPSPHSYVGHRVRPGLGGDAAGPGLQLPRIPGRSRGADAALQLVCEAPLRVSPGTEMFYDSGNYDLLGEIVALPLNRPLAFSPGRGSSNRSTWPTAACPYLTNARAR